MTSRISPRAIRTFRACIHRYYRAHGRDLPWRSPALKLRKDGSLNPYRILVSEVMLQQTQVARVISKYHSFLREFPDVHALARAPVARVLRAWQGLGYNRRALNMHRTARVIAKEYGGQVPNDMRTLQTLPGIGIYTARAVRVFAFAEPEVVIETNIRRVFIHHFFPRGRAVHDREIIPVIERTLNRRSPREWYWALMDYGSSLAGRISNPNRRSKHYAKQSRFDGSHRQIRGAILRILSDGAMTTRRIDSVLKNMETMRIRTALKELESEGFLVRSGVRYALKA